MAGVGLEHRLHFLLDESSWKADRCSSRKEQESRTLRQSANQEESQGNCDGSEHSFRSSSSSSARDAGANDTMKMVKAWGLCWSSTIGPRAWHRTKVAVNGNPLSLNPSNLTHDTQLIG